MSELPKLDRVVPDEYDRAKNCFVSGIGEECAVGDGPVREPVYRFGAFALDPHRGTLDKHGRPIFLRPKAYSLLLHLARNSGRVVPKSELMEAVWPNTFVTEDSLTQTIREIRKGLEDTEQQVVRTITRRGYMLASRIEAELDRPDAQPVVAVLRFRNEGGGPAEESFVDGFADDIANGITRFGSVTVLARNTTFAFASFTDRDMPKLSTHVGADYLVEGAVRRSGARAWIGVNLIDASRAVQLWGDRYETENLGLFEVQQEIGVQIVSRLMAHLGQAYVRKIDAKSTTDLEAYELVMRGSTGLRSFRLSDAAQSLQYFEEAVDRDPVYGLAYGFLALTRIIVRGIGNDVLDFCEDALRLATRAVNLAPDQAMGHRAMALAQLGLGRHAGAEAALRRAMEANRYDADGFAQMGYLQTLRGRPADGLAWLDRALRLNPIQPFWYHHDRALALYQLGEYREAAAAMDVSPSLPPWIRIRLAACYVQLGDMNEARRNALMIEPTEGHVSALDYVAYLPFEHPCDREHLEAGARIALALL